MRTPAHARLSTCVSQFSFFLNPGGLNINIFCENWHEASFYIFFCFKNIFLPSKSVFLVFEEKPYKILFDPQNSAFLSFETTTLKNLFSFCPIVLALKTIAEQMLFWSLFLKMH